MPHPCRPLVLLIGPCLAMGGCVATRAPDAGTVDFVYHNPAQPDFTTASIRDMDAMAARVRERCGHAPDAAACPPPAPH